MSAATTLPGDGHRQRSRRRFLGYALGGACVLVAAGAAGFELVEHGLLPGKSALDQLTGACDVPAPDLTPYAAPGPERSGTFYSAARRTTVGYTIGYPPGHAPGDRLPLVIALHGLNGNHTNALAGITPSQALALPAESATSGSPVALPPMALVTVDGGGGYWNPHPGDNPQAMLVDELIPMCQRAGLGTGVGQLGVLGISMGGYGAILLAEKYPRLVRAVAAISPAIFTSYAQAKATNPDAYATAADFAADDAITHAAALADTPVRIAIGRDDPFYPGVQTLSAALPKTAQVHYGNGCHTDPFFTAQLPPSLTYLSKFL
jgi:S-formylglutathione hydrolase FrmB